MPYFLKGNCVWKGTEEKPVEEVKCHGSAKEAEVHIRALYANVQDADEKAAWDAEIEKGGSGSGWHKPPRGTHDAENAPNFRGGPGADRTYGTESDEPPEGTKLCKCTKCGSTFTLPKGKQCKDVECPGCGGRAEQTSPRRDKPAEGEEGSGSGGRGGKKEVDCPACEEAAKAQETHECTCPECGKSVQVPLGQKCGEVRCPECKAMMKQGEEDKALTPSGAGNVHGEGSMLGEVASVMDDGEGSEKPECKCPHCGKGIPCTAKACPYCKKTIDKVERGDEKSFTVYKSADGTWRWMTLSSWAVVDKEREVVSERAYQDAIAYAQKTGNWGQLDLVHVAGTDVGDCDTLFTVKGGDEPAKLGAGGTWYDTEKATRARAVIQAEPDAWGVSIKFRFNPARFVRGIYTGDIQVLKHSILPQEMAASYGTAIAVQGGKEMSKELDEKAAEALTRLGHTEEEIEQLAQKQKALPTEPNVAEKEDATEEPLERESIWKALGRALGITPAPPTASEPEEARKADEVNPAATAETAEKVGGDEPESAGVLVQALGETIAKSVGEMVRVELEKRDTQIAGLQQQVTALGESVEEKVEARLRDLPQVVKVAASEVGATAVAEEKPRGLTFGQSPGNTEKWNKEFLATVERMVDEKVAGAKYSA